MNARIRVVLADDHPIVLSGLRSLVSAESDLELVGEATTGTQALKVIREQKPDVAVIDISMPELNGIVLSRRIGSEIASVRILILTLHEDRAYLRQALNAGVRGYLLKRSAPENLVQAIRAVFTGGLSVDPAIAHRLFDSAPRHGNPVREGCWPDLTDRESDVLSSWRSVTPTRKLPVDSTLASSRLRPTNLAAWTSSALRRVRSLCATRRPRAGWRRFDLLFRAFSGR